MKTNVKQPTFLDSEERKNQNRSLDARPIDRGGGRRGVPCGPLLGLKLRERSRGRDGEKEKCEDWERIRRDGRELNGKCKSGGPNPPKVLEMDSPDPLLR